MIPITESLHLVCSLINHNMKKDPAFDSHSVSQEILYKINQIREQHALFSKIFNDYLVNYLDDYFEHEYQIYTEFKYGRFTGIDFVFSGEYK